MPVNAPPPCRKVTVIGFAGDRSRAKAAALQKALDDEKSGRGPGPALLDFLLFLGHVGLSVDDLTTILGFHPDDRGVPGWQLLDRLKKGEAFPGTVRDDTGVVFLARDRGLKLHYFDVILPQPQFQAFVSRLDGERQKSQYSYGFPNGDGDCNCITWIERLGLPLLTGRVSEFARLAFLPRRRFGQCQ